MSALSSKLVGITKQHQVDSRDSRGVLRREASNELVFAVVGHAGSGTTAVTNALRTILTDVGYSADVIKASAVIEDWATLKGYSVPLRGQKRLLKNVELLQDYGDEMRSELYRGVPDHAAVARGMMACIQRSRAQSTGQAWEPGREIEPDGDFRAYILDSIRHPAEVNLLRNVYADAFLLIGVVCEEEKRIDRMQRKYEDCGRQAAIDFMRRDADDAKKNGQHVADAFHLADFFVDNTVHHDNKRDWKVNDNLSRLVKIIVHSELIRPRLNESAMYHAFSAQLQSACLSRQVGAALVDRQGNVIATGTNEVPRAGGGVYGESSQEEAADARCAMFADANLRYCRNTAEQNKIVAELLAVVAPDADDQKRQELGSALRKTRIGGLLEFSRAVHAEMDALLSAARKGVSLVGAHLFVTTFPCHYCARHIVAAGVDEVQFIEPYPKSQALQLHEDSIVTEATGWTAPSEGGNRVLFRPFSGVAPRLYERAFLKNRELKDKSTGKMEIQEPEWLDAWHLSRRSYAELEARLSDRLPDDERPESTTTENGAS